MSCEQEIRRSERAPVSEIILAEGVPTAVTDAPSIENTQTFFSAISFPIDGKNPPKPFYVQTEQEGRNWEILGRHVGTDAVLEESGTGENYKVTKERARQIVEKLVDQSHEAAPAALKETFPRKILATIKPYSLHKAMRYSDARGGKMRRVMEAANKGKSLKEIVEATGASDAKLFDYRSLGIAVPYMNEAQRKGYQENLGFLANGLLDDRQITAIFDDIEVHNRRRVCQGLAQKGVLISLGKAARSEVVFIQKHQSSAYRLLKQLDIPVIHIGYLWPQKDKKQVKLDYFYVLNNHDGTRKAFAHPSFDIFRTNPVEILGKATTDIPTTNIVKDPAYVSVGKLLIERGVIISTNQVRKQHIDSDCPVSLYHLRNQGLFVRGEDADALVEYLRTKATS